MNVDGKVIFQGAPGLTLKRGDGNFTSALSGLSMGHYIDGAILETSLKKLYEVKKAQPEPFDLDKLVAAALSRLHYSIEANAAYSLKQFNDASRLVEEARMEAALEKLSDDFWRKYYAGDITVAAKLQALGISPSIMDSDCEDKAYEALYAEARRIRADPRFIERINSLKPKYTYWDAIKAWFRK